MREFLTLLCKLCAGVMLGGFLGCAWIGAVDVATDHAVHKEALRVIDGKAYNPNPLVRT